MQKRTAEASAVLLFYLFILIWQDAIFLFPPLFIVERCRELLEKAGIQILHEVSADGASELLQDLMNGLDDTSYAQYLRYYFYISEKPEFLGMRNHLLFAGN